MSCGPALGKVSVFGRGTTGGANGVAYRIEFVDAGEPGEGRDTYRILLSTGYDSGSQKLLTGNVQVHG